MSYKYDELALTFRNEIADRHAECVSIDDELTRVVKLKTEKVREVGGLLEAAKAELGAERFEDLKKSLPIAQGAIATYIKFARDYDAPIDSFSAALFAISKACQATGALPGPARCSEAHTVHEPSFFADFKYSIQRMTVAWAKYIALRPVETWPKDEADQFALSMRPIIEIFRAVRDFAQQK